MEHLKQNSSRITALGCPLSVIWGQIPFLKLLENYKPAVDAMQTSGPGSVVEEDSQL